jgi:hypothetical protein
MISRSKPLFAWMVSRLSIIAALALLTPLLFGSLQSRNPLRVGVPLIFSGDEPHYLVLINSLILDGDLDLANNYAAARRGSADAGRIRAGYALDHHTVWFENGERRNWWQVYELDPWKFDSGSVDHRMARLRAGQRAPPAGHPEYSTHPVGLAIFLAPVLFPFRGTGLVEPLAVICSAIAVVVGFFMFRLLLAKYGAGSRAVDAVAVVAFLGTPAWHYARTLFTEPYLLLLAVSAYSLALRAGSPLVAGGLIGCGILMKPPFALLLVPLLAMYLMDRDLGSAVRLSVPVLIGIGVLLAMNHAMFGSPWRASQEWIPGSLVTGATGLLFSPKYGLLITMPAVVVALAAWPSFFCAFPRDAAVLGSAILLYFLCFASFDGWHGASAYAARHLVPVMPLLFVSMIALPRMKLWRGARRGIVVVCALSIIINAAAAMQYWRSWDTNLPLRVANRLGL